MPAALERCPALPEPDPNGLKMSMAIWGTMYKECQTKQEMVVWCLKQK